MPTIKLHYPTATVIAEAIRNRLTPKPGDIVLVFDPYSIFIGNITILLAIDSNNTFGMPFKVPETTAYRGDQTYIRFVAPATPTDEQIHYWTYAYKVPEEYAHVETSND